MTTRPQIPSTPEAPSKSEALIDRQPPLVPLAADVVVDIANRVKTLPPSVVKDIEQKNIARRLANLSPIVIKVRRCIACGSLFESAGNRTCGCSSRTAGTIAGREII